MYFSTHFIFLMLFFVLNCKQNSARTQRRYMPENSYFKQVFRYDDVLQLANKTLFSQLSHPNEYKLPMTYETDLSEICNILSYKFPDTCKSWDNYSSEQFEAEVKQTKTLQQKQKEAICKGILADNPSFCRKDAEIYHTCDIRHEFLLLNNVCVDSGLPIGSIFTPQGDLFFTDPYKRKRSLSHLSEDKAKNLIAKCIHGTNCIQIQEAVYAVGTIPAFFHMWVEVLPQILFSLLQFPENQKGTVKFIVHPAIFTSGVSQALLEGGVIQNTNQFISMENTAQLYQLSILYLPLTFQRRKSNTSRINSNSATIFDGKCNRKMKNIDNHIGLHNSNCDISWSLGDTHCSWIMGLPTTLVRDFLWTWLGLYQPQSVKVILIVHRGESGKKRKLLDAGILLQAIHAAFPVPRYSVLQFIGEDHSLAASFKLFRQSDLVIAVHGAALSFVQAMRPGTAVLELGFRDRRPNCHLTYDFFRLLAYKLGLQYGIHADREMGNFDTDLRLNITRVVEMAKRLV